MPRRPGVIVAITTVLAVVTTAVYPIADATAGEAAVGTTAGPILVDRADDAGSGTLRAAIEEANARPGADAIVVEVDEAIPASSSLPAITDAVTIDGARAGLRSAGAGGGAGITVLAEDVSITGFTISGFETGIVVDRASHVTVTDNAIVDNTGAGVAIVGPTSEEIAAALAAGTGSLEELVALLPTDVLVQGNVFARNGGPAVTRGQDGVIAIETLTRDTDHVRGVVRDSGENPSVEVYASTACEDDRPQAETPLGTAAVAADGTFELALPTGTGAITAIASDDLSGTGSISKSRGRDRGGSGNGHDNVGTSRHGGHRRFDRVGGAARCSGRDR